MQVRGQAFADYHFLVNPVWGLQNMPVDLFLELPLEDRQDAEGYIARLAGIRPEQLWTDPGFGFGKTPAQNLMLVRNLSQVVALGHPVLLGTSRKSTLGLVLDEPDPLRREAAHHATITWGIAQGCAMIRAHDVAALRGIIRTADAIRRSPNGGPG